MHTHDSLIDPVETTQSSAPKKRRPGLVAAGVLLILILLATGIVPRLIRTSQAKEVARAHEVNVPTVLTTKAHLSPPTSELKLPANIEAVYTASLYARTDGYVKRRFVDIGDRVKAGQLLAEIESPEVDQQLAQAKAALGQSKAAYEQAKANLVEAKAAVNQTKANLEQAKANEEIARTTDARWTRLVSRGVLAKQAGDEKRSTFNARQAEVTAAAATIETAEATVLARQASLDAARANIDAAQANVGRLQQMVSFERVVAPFDGIITERKIERGDLVAAGNGSPQAKLFAIAQSDILRIQVQVPQVYASDIQNGQTADIDVTNRAATHVTGKVVRSANALNQESRTLLTEIQVDNKQGLLLPGMYAEVKFVLPRGHSLVLVPADTLVVNASGTRVVTVGQDHRAHYKTIEMGRDLGPEVEVLNGLNGDEQLVSNPTDALTEGQPVELRAGAATGKS
jgi:RND family efflux transporter MFP subunit